jgi:hypothetical protein
MFVNTTQFQTGIINFVEQELFYKANDKQKFVISFISPSIPKLVQKYINILSSNELFADYFNENGHIDIDMVYSNSKKAIQKSGQFEFLGVILGETDIDKIYSYIRNTTV